MLKIEDLSFYELDFFKKIIQYMIAENKKPEDILDILESYEIVELSLRDLKSFIKRDLEKEWDYKQNCWAATAQLNFLPSCTPNSSNKKSAESNFDPTDKNVCCIKINPNIKIAALTEIELAMASLNEGVDIHVSPNDAATLLKNMVQIQSKLNEIVRAINKLVETMYIK